MGWKMPKKEYIGGDYSQTTIQETGLVTAIDVRTGVLKQIDEIEALRDQILQELCLFSLIESLAQEHAAYPPRDQQRVFTGFVLKFDDEHKLLNKTDPVTLFYHVENQIDPEDLHDLETDLSRSIGLGKDNLWRVINSPIADRILGCINVKFGQSYADKLKRQHRYVDLLYRLRCKLSHENQPLGGTNQYSPFIEATEPYYIEKRLLNKDRNGIYRIKYWAPIIPLAFIKDVLISCLDKYLEYCRESHIHPYSNNAKERSCLFSWYDDERLPEPIKELMGGE